MFSLTPQTKSVRCPEHPSDLTPSEARQLALDLAALADAADGWVGLRGFVTRWEVLAELSTLREEVARLRARAG